MVSGRATGSTFLWANTSKEYGRRGGGVQMVGCKGPSAMCSTTLRLSLTWTLRLGNQELGRSEFDCLHDLIAFMVSHYQTVVTHFVTVWHESVTICEHHKPYLTCLCLGFGHVNRIEACSEELCIPYSLAQRPRWKHWEWFLVWYPGNKEMHGSP